MVQSLVTSSSGAVISTQQDDFASNFTTTSTSFVDVTGLTLTITNNTGSYYASMILNADNNLGGGSNVQARLNEGGSARDYMIASISTNGFAVPLVTSIVGTNDGQTLKGQFKTSGGTATAYGSTSGNFSKITVLEIA